MHDGECWGRLGKMEKASKSPEWLCDSSPALHLLNAKRSRWTRIMQNSHFEVCLLTLLAALAYPPLPLSLPEVYIIKPVGTKFSSMWIWSRP